MIFWFIALEKKLFLCSNIKKRDIMNINTDALPHLGNSMEDTLGIVFLPAEEDGTVHAEMPVDHRTCQPYGTLHGGASLALAESLAGHASLEICAENEIAFGMQVSGNHIRPVKVGNKVHASGKLTHRGSNTHIWDITISTETGKLVASIRVVNYIKRIR